MIDFEDNNFIIFRPIDVYYKKKTQFSAVKYNNYLALFWLILIDDFGYSKFH